MKTVVFVLLFSTMFLQNIFSQNPPCFKEYQGFTFPIILNPNSPPITNDMPLDVIIGYKTLDSISKNIDTEEFYNFLKKLSYNDTLKKIMKYYYKMLEFNSELYFNYTLNNHPSKFSISDYEYPFINHVQKVSPYHNLDAALLASNVIAKITIEKVSEYYDTTAVVAKHSRIVHASVDKLFKGNKSINCNDSYNSNRQDNCVIFDYANDWFSETNPNFEMIEGQSYFIFLSYNLVCKTNSTLYSTLLPLGSTGSKSWSIYPIVNNNLIDEFNELGLGSKLQLNNFYDSINNRINEIKNF